MAVYQLRTFADIIAAVREEVGIQSTDTTAINRIKRDINIVYEEIQERDWWWLRGETTVQQQAYLATGTASVTEGSATVTLSSGPTDSKTGYMFAVDGFDEIYPIESHTAGSTTVKLSEFYAGDTSSSATYKIWRDRQVLPTDCKETIEVRHAFRSAPLIGKGLKEFRAIQAMSPAAEGKPRYYCTTDFIDPVPTSAITSLPAISTRASAGVVKTIVFASGLPSAVTTAYSNGDPIRWRVAAAGAPSYNGDIFVSSISTTSVANDTITYTGKAELQESATADTTMSIRAIDTEADYDRYRELMLYPCLDTDRITLHVDYIKELPPLSADSDEPAIPLQYRRVLLYGALASAWTRNRNPEEADKNEAKYRQMLGKMAGQLQDSQDKPRLRPSQLYLNAKRRLI
jgi:hypothetical protein